MANIDWWDKFIEDNRACETKQEFIAMKRETMRTIHRKDDCVLEICKCLRLLKRYLPDMSVSKIIDYVANPFSPVRMRTDEMILSDLKRYIMAYNLDRNGEIDV